MKGFIPYLLFLTLFVGIASGCVKNKPSIFDEVVEEGYIRKLPFDMCHYAVNKIYIAFHDSGFYLLWVPDIENDFIHKLKSLSGNSIDITDPNNAKTILALDFYWEDGMLKQRRLNIDNPHVKFSVIINGEEQWYETYLAGDIYTSVPSRSFQLPLNGIVLGEDPSEIGIYSLLLGVNVVLVNGHKQLMVGIIKNDEFGNTDLLFLNAESLLEVLSE